MHTEGITRELDRLVVFFHVFNNGELVLVYILVNSGLHRRIS